MASQFILPLAGGRIAKGERRSPSTEIMLGQHLSARTEFKPGQAAHNKLPVGAVTFRTVRGRTRAFVKVAEPNVWRERAKIVWEAEHGRPVPRGLVIHHRDRDSINDDPRNLQALTRKQHALEHLDEAQAAGFGSVESRAAAYAARQAGALPVAAAIGAAA